MNKSDFLRSIAERGYDIGFGAKKHLATYDIIEKIPGWIGFLSIAFGIFSLAFENLSNQLFSAIFVILGVVSLYVGLYAHQKQQYEKSGKALTILFYELKKLYMDVKSIPDDSDFSDGKNRFKAIEDEFYSSSISRQIFLSNWYAHYKFFWEFQIEWINEQLGFSFFRDKFPLSLWCFIIFVLCFSSFWFLDLIKFICEFNALKS